MRLDRNNGRLGKYDLINNRTGAREECIVGSPNEFFVIKLKDRFAQAALQAYADAAMEWDLEYAAEIIEMANRSGPDHPNCKYPD